MRHELLFSGIGGQGVMVLGESLCAAAIKEGYMVTFAPFYGQEKRGGRTMCNVVVSDEMGSPIISAAELMLVMDEKSFVSFEPQVAEGGTLIVNSSMIQAKSERKDINVLEVPIYEIAQKLGNSKASNMVALGLAAKYLPFISVENIEKEIENAFANKPKLIPMNIEAFRAGYNYE